MILLQHKWYDSPILNAKKFGRFFIKFWTIFERISDEYNLQYNFQDVTYFEALQNVTV